MSPVDRRSISAARSAMHGPLWTAEDATTQVWLWAPNAKRAWWSIAWTVTDGAEEDAEIVGQGYEKRPSLQAALAATPQALDDHAAAVAELADDYDPAEVCDHTRAESLSQTEPGVWLCGYCGQKKEGEPR